MACMFTERRRPLAHTTVLYSYNSTIYIYNIYFELICTWICKFKFFNTVAIAI